MSPTAAAATTSMVTKARSTDRRRAPTATAIAKASARRVTTAWPSRMAKPKNNRAPSVVSSRRPSPTTPPLVRASLSASARDRTSASVPLLEAEADDAATRAIAEADSVVRSVTNAEIPAASGSRRSTVEVRGAIATGPPWNPNARTRRTLPVTNPAPSAIRTTSPGETPRRRAKVAERSTQASPDSARSTTVASVNQLAARFEPESANNTVALDGWGRPPPPPDPAVSDAGWTRRNEARAPPVACFRSRATSAVEKTPLTS